MAPPLQAKFLRVLEDCSYRRVGSTQERQADVRIVAATNKDLVAEQNNGRFREDLFYRLNVVTINLPCLQDRPDDISELVQHFLTNRQIGPKPFIIQPEALAALTRYTWPGNVRELANVLEHAQILAEDNIITLDDLPDNLVQTVPMSAAAVDPNSRRLCDVECRYVAEILHEENGNKVRAAKALGISRRSLYRLIEKYNLANDTNRD